MTRATFPRHQTNFWCCVQTEPTLPYENLDEFREFSRYQKRRAYNLVKTAFRFRLRLRRLHSTYDLVNTRLSESEAEAEELNQSQSVGMCIVILSFRFCFRLRQSGFH